MDQSSPRGRSVNVAIPKKHYPAKMGGVTELLRALNFCGSGCFLIKCDWVAAYKHFWIRPEQRKYQYFKLLGRVFTEVCLTFGNSSSPGLFNRGARLVVLLVVLLVSFHIFLTIQHLDDLVAVAPARSKLAFFYDTYKRVCGEIGVVLAGDEDCEKAFAPCREGQCLGITFNTEAWIWSLGEEKVARYANSCLDLAAKDTATLQEVMSVEGKIQDLQPDEGSSSGGTSGYQGQSD